MPITRYFVVVGSTLAILLLLAGWSLPVLPDRFPHRSEIVHGGRILSTHKWPEKIILDTDQPMLSPSSIDMTTTAELAEHEPGEALEPTLLENSSNSIAKAKPDARLAVAYRPPARGRHKRITRSRVRAGNETQGLDVGCCWFEQTERRTTSGRSSRKRFARQDTRGGRHFLGSD